MSVFDDIKCDLTFKACSHADTQWEFSYIFLNIIKSRGYDGELGVMESI